MKKNLLVLNFEFPPLGGGASPVSYELTRQLSETGRYDVDVVTTWLHDLLHYEEISDSFRIHRVWSGRKKQEVSYPWEHLLYLIKAFFVVRKLIKSKSYDVCHTHFIIPTGVLAYIVKKIYGLPYVITAHGSDVLGYNQRFARLYPILKYPWRIILNNAKTVTVPSRFLQNKILSVYPEAEKLSLKVVPNGIHLNQFKPQTKKPYIFTSGRLQKHKGFQYIIEAVRECDWGLTLHIAGDGPMRAELEDLAKDSKTPIVFHGWLNQTGVDYKNLVEQASIFVLMSEAESFGLVVAEAMSAGCVAVVRDGCGMAEVAGEAGVLVDQSGNDLAEVLHSIVNNKNFLPEYQKRSLARVKEFAWSKIVAKYEKIL